MKNKITYYDRVLISIDYWIFIIGLWYYVLNTLGSVL